MRLLQLSRVQRGVRRIVSCRDNIHHKAYLSTLPHRGVSSGLFSNGIPRLTNPPTSHFHSMTSTWQHHEQAGRIRVARAWFGSYRGRDEFVPEDDFEDDDLLDDGATEVEGYFSKLYGRGSVLSQEDVKGSSKSNKNSSSKPQEYDEMDEKFMGFDGYHVGMTPERKQQWLKKRQLFSQEGRLWQDPLEITDEEWSSELWWDDLPDWTPDVVSAAALERVTVLDQVLTLQQLSTLPLPPPPPVVPAENPKLYAQYRQQAEERRIASTVRTLAADRVQHILGLSDPAVQQDAIDELFELIEEEVREAEGLWKVHRNGPEPHSVIPEAVLERRVEHALREYLQEVAAAGQTQDEEAKSDEKLVTDDTAHPVFMDTFRSTLGKDKVFGVTGASGSIVEEWEMSAHTDTKRILLRQCVRQVAQHLVQNEASATKVFVQGQRGVGKSALLNATVASARESGAVVLFLKDADRLRRMGKFIEPCPLKPGMFDVPVLAQETCQQLLEVHGAQLETLTPSEAALSFLHKSVDESSSLTDILRKGMESTEVSSGCYSCVIETLMNQTDVPFIVIMDEYNCYFDEGKYYHEAYDPEVENPIPYHLITFFQPFIHIGLEADQPAPPLMKRGALVAATTFSRPVAKKKTHALMKRVAQEESVHVVEVPRYSAQEVEYVLANYEATGMGSLRFDEGRKLANPQEIAYYRQISGGVGYKLMEAAVAIA